MAALMALTRHLGFRVRFSHTRSGEMCVEWNCGCVGIGKTGWNELDYRGCAKHSDPWATTDAQDDDCRIENLA
jgi:hypothetical protein